MICRTGFLDVWYSNGHGDVSVIKGFSSWVSRRGMIVAFNGLWMVKYTAGFGRKEEKDEHTFGQGKQWLIYSVRDKIKVQCFRLGERLRRWRRRLAPLLPVPPFLEAHLEIFIAEAFRDMIERYTCNKHGEQCRSGELDEKGAPSCSTSPFLSSSSKKSCWRWVGAWKINKYSAWCSPSQNMEFQYVPLKP